MLRPTLLKKLGRHQVASIFATALDFSVMTALVELLVLPAAIATLFGALGGALLNFQLGRHWTFGAHDHPAAPQALRYALVSAGSAALNAGGEYLLHDGFAIQYFLARLIVSVSVSLLWNFPMQHRFVFKTEGAAAR